MNILIVDDELAFAGILAEVLDAEGYSDVRTAPSAEDALHQMSDRTPDLVVTDLKMPGMNGLEFLSMARSRYPKVDVILMTAFADIQTARQALKRGAIDFLVKPFENIELLDLIRQVESRRGIRLLSEPLEGFSGMIGGSPPMRRVYSAIERVGKTDATVLILGESGTGKQLVARAVHLLSARSSGPFHEIQCANLPEHLLESELFGHEKGSFTGAEGLKKGRVELAAGGTLFLDEIGEIPLSLQSKLLAFIQERKFHRVGGTKEVSVDVRIVAATNKDLLKETREQKFRSDLYYRLESFTIWLPPLRDRREDIPSLAAHFLKIKGQPVSGISVEALSALQAYDWPGNVRELENVVMQSIIESGDGPIDIDSLPARFDSSANFDNEPIRTPLSMQDLNLEDNERLLIHTALKRAQGNKTEAARLLGITRRRLYSRMAFLKVEDI